MAELMQSIGRYWTRRAPSYTDVIKKEPGGRMGQGLGR